MNRHLRHLPTTTFPLRCTRVIRGASMPWAVDLTSSIAEVSGALPSLWKQTWAAA